MCRDASPQYGNPDCQGCRFRRTPIHSDEHYLNDLRIRILAGLREMRQPGEKVDMDSKANREIVNAAFAELAKLGLQGLKTEDLAKLRPVDDYEEELIVMAETRAFWQLAYKVLFILLDIWMLLQMDGFADG